MKTTKRLIVLAVVAGALLFSLAIFTPVDRAEALVLCIPKPTFECPDVYDPVICDGGRIFSNACYAARACATGCVPTSGAIE